MTNSDRMMSTEAGGATQAAPGLGRQILAGVLFLAVVAAIAVFGSMATMPNTDGWYAEVERAPWSPPDALFGPVWSALYFLIALAGFLIWRAGFRGGGQRNAASGALTLFVVQMVLNSLWTPVFFAGYPAMGEPAWWIALVIIVALVLTLLVLIPKAWRWSKIASIVLIPYLLWVSFATSLNLAIIVLN